MKHVFVIDDNEVVASALSDTLRRLGFSTEVFNDPQAFLRDSIPVSPAVILLDMRMPVMSGVDLQKKLTALGRKTPIIFMSGESQPAEIVEGMKLGAVDFLFKPFNLKDLLSAIQQALNKDMKNSQDSLRQLSLVERYGNLTGREKEVCNLLVRGMLSKAIAIELGISDATVKVHKARVLQKMQAASLQQLALDIEKLDVR